MEFKVKSSNIESKYKAEFTFEVKVMFGDGENYKILEVGGFKKTSEKTLDRMAELVKVLYELEMQDRDGYEDVKGFKKWFGRDWNIPEDFKEEYNSMDVYEKALYLNEWPEDPRAWVPAKLEGYQVFYYDQLGNKHEVEVEISEEDYEKWEDEEMEEDC